MYQRRDQSVRESGHGAQQPRGDNRSDLERGLSSLGVSKPLTLQKQVGHLF